ncbi:MAG: flagellar export protein FliJ [Lachnospiraceae bacterium]|nr:flagellar export protein FliJ [Lachnospiraceae bacterium]
MARFRYRMQSILNLKVKLETQAKQELGLAQQALNTEEGKLSELKARKIEYIRSTRHALEGELNVRDIKDNQQAIKVMDDFIESQMVRVDMARKEVDRATDKLRECMVERKAQETLRQKAFEQFMKEENKAEMKEIDQLTSYMYSQGD